jgi:hypothetical protein
LLWANVLLSLMQVQPSGWTFALLVPAAILLALSAFAGPETADQAANELRNEFRRDLRAGCHYPDCRDHPHEIQDADQVEMRQRTDQDLRATVKPVEVQAEYPGEERDLGGGVPGRVQAVVVVLVGIKPPPAGRTRRPKEASPRTAEVGGSVRGRELGDVGHRPSL